VAAETGPYGALGRPSPIVIGGELDTILPKGVKVMFRQKDLQELAAYQGQTPILSVYLNVDPTERTTDEYRLALRQMLKRANGFAAKRI
jgi:predicted alternative tryptophan synthase beta-subunit